MRTFIVLTIVAAQLPTGASAAPVFTSPGWYPVESPDEENGSRTYSGPYPSEADCKAVISGKNVETPQGKAFRLAQAMGLKIECRHLTQALPNDR